MSHLWIEEQPGDWAAMPLNQPRVALELLSPAVNRSGGANDRRLPVTLVRHPERARAPWHLLAASGTDVWVNGIPLVGGLRVLDDRDHIRIGDDGRFFFSTEDLARVDPMPGADKAMVCPRCRQPIERGTAAVRCPQCALWHHQSSELPCWTYSPTCALCPQPTALDAGFQWTPVEL